MVIPRDGVTTNAIELWLGTERHFPLLTFCSNRWVLGVMDWLSAAGLGLPNVTVA